MNPKFLAMKKDALHYYQSQNHLINNLCEPVKTFLDVDLFTRGTIILNSQGEAVGLNSLMTNLELLDFYMLQFDDDTTGKPFVRAIRETPLNSYSYFLWPTGESCPLVQVCLQKFGFTRGLTIYKRHPERIEAWWFASKDSRGIPSTITQISLTPFFDFMHCFEKKRAANNLLKPVVQYPKLFDLSFIQPNLYKAEGLNFSKNTDKFVMNIKDRTVLLTKREWECLSEISQGKTYKEVANTLSISPRTVEDYVIKLKVKTGASHRSKLVHCFLENNQYSNSMF